MMKTLVSAIIKAYRQLLRLYPSSFRDEFASEMLADFSDMAKEASQRGIFPLVRFCLKEAVDFPINLARMVWMVSPVFKTLRSQPVNSGLRSALSFGVAFGLTLPITMFAYQLLAPLDELVTRLQVFYYDLFHAEQGFELIAWIPSALSSLFTGLILGVLLAFLFADRPRTHRFILSGVLGWFFYRAMHDLFTIHFNFWVFLDGIQYTAFSYMLMVFSGAIFGLIFVVAHSEGRQPIRLLLISIFVFPLLTNLFLERLFEFFVFKTPWRFVGSAILMAALVMSVFILARKIDGRRKIPLVVIVGAAGYPIIMFLAYFFAGLTAGLSSQFYSFTPFWQRTLMFAIEQAIYGTLFGSLLGLVFGFQKKSGPPVSAISA